MTPNDIRKMTACAEGAQILPTSAHAVSVLLRVRPSRSYRKSTRPGIKSAALSKIWTHSAAGTLCMLRTRKRCAATRPKVQKFLARTKAPVISDHCSRSQSMLTNASQANAVLFEQSVETAARIYFAAERLYVLVGV